MPGETLSLKCGCGYVKHDVIHLGPWENREKRLLKYCGGLFLVNQQGDGVTCKKCGVFSNQIEFFCAFCSKVTTIPVQYRLAAISGQATIVQMSVHKTVVFSIKSWTPSNEDPARYTWHSTLCRFLLEMKIVYHKCVLYKSIKLIYRLLFLDTCSLKGYVMSLPYTQAMWGRKSVLKSSGPSLIRPSIISLLGLSKQWFSTFQINAHHVHVWFWSTNACERLYLGLHDFAKYRNSLNLFAARTTFTGFTNSLLPYCPDKRPCIPV